MKLPHRTLLVLVILTLSWASPSAAQPSDKVWRIGFLNNASRIGSIERSTQNLLRGLRELGYVEGKNIRIEWRFAESRPERLAPLAAELVGQTGDVPRFSGGACCKAWYVPNSPPNFPQFPHVASLVPRKRPAS